MKTQVFKEVNGKLTKFTKYLLRVEKQLSVMIIFIKTVIHLHQKNSGFVCLFVSRRNKQEDHNQKVTCYFWICENAFSLPLKMK